MVRYKISKHEENKRITYTWRKLSKDNKDVLEFETWRGRYKFNNAQPEKPSKHADPVVSETWYYTITFWVCKDHEPFPFWREHACVWNPVTQKWVNTFERALVDHRFISYYGLTIQGPRSVLGFLDILLEDMFKTEPVKDEEQNEKERVELEEFVKEIK